MLFCNVGGATLIKLANSQEMTLPGSFVCFLSCFLFADVGMSVAILQKLHFFSSSRPTSQPQVVCQHATVGGTRALDTCGCRSFGQRHPGGPSDSQNTDGSLSLSLFLPLSLSPSLPLSLSLGLPPICLHSAQGCGREKWLWFPPLLHTEWRKAHRQHHLFFFCFAFFFPSLLNTAKPASYPSLEMVMSLCPMLTSIGQGQPPSI